MTDHTAIVLRLLDDGCLHSRGVSTVLRLLADGHWHKAVEIR